MDKALNDVINCIAESTEYKDCIELKNKMESNEDIKIRVNKIKALQKKLLRTQDMNIEEELKNLENELNGIPIYVMYNQKLNIINEKISFVTDEINDYFYKLLNEE